MLCRAEYICYKEAQELAGKTPHRHDECTHDPDSHYGHICPGQSILYYLLGEKPCKARKTSVGMV
jgi:hypothetical protein